MPEQNTVIILFPKGFLIGTAKARLWVNGQWQKITEVETGVVEKYPPHHRLQYNLPHETIGSTIKTTLSKLLPSGFVHKDIHSFFVSNKNELKAVVRRSGRVMWVGVYNEMCQDTKVEGVSHVG